MAKLIDDFIKIMGEGEGSVIKSPQKKFLYFLFVIVLVGILLMFVNSLFGVKNSPKVSDAAPVKTASVEKDTSSRLKDVEKDLGQNLETVLTRIEGVGKVTAQVSLASSSENEYAIDASTVNKTTEEKDTKGAVRTVTEVTKNGKLVMIKETQSGKEAPVLIKEVKPEIQGVLVIAEGAGDIEVRAEIAEAVETLYHLPAHKVTVLPMESR